MYAIVDIETTGKGFRSQKITEISIFVYDGKKIVNEFTSLVNPEQDIPPFITNLTGITNAMVRYAPKFYEIAKTVAQLTENTIFIAHNVNFDYKIIQSEFQSLGYSFSRKKLCTVRLSRKLIPGLPSYSLGNLCAHLGIPISDRHRAKGDAEATVKLFEVLQKRDQHFVIESYLHPRLKQATLPPLLDKQKVDDLPETPGVYYFKNHKKEIIYVGKAVHLKQRVISHFYDKKKKEQEMCLEIADISYRETGSELLALLLESSEIKTYFPTYNRAQKYRNDTIGLFGYENQKGILQIAYAPLKNVRQTLLNFNSVQECRSFIETLCEEFELCPKYCHLQVNVNQCSHYQIDSCRGICCGKESVDEYNKRVHKALNSLKLHQQHAVIKEQGRTPDELGFVLILEGQYRGFGYVDKHIEKTLSDPQDYEFFVEPRRDNRDVQQILKWYLQKKGAI